MNQDNSHRGLIYQELVGNHLINLTGEEANIKASHGVDVTCGEYRVEVKGTKSLYQETIRKRTKKIDRQVRGWKGQPKFCPENITHFAFVLDECNVSSTPIIYMVDIKHIRERFEEYPNSEWVRFPVWWVWEHYDYKLSLIP
jgi:hypothetical protein